MMDAPDIQTLYALTPSAVVAEFKGSKLRIEALRETAVGLGTRAGLNKRTLEIKERVEAQAPYFNRVYNFRSLLISAPAGLSKTTQYAVLPPVITEERQTLTKVNDMEIQSSDRVFRIEQQAKFVTAPPTWQLYLDQSITPIEPPHPSLLPKTSEEKSAWKTWIDEGWNLGVRQADAIFESNLNRLSRDYQGMVRYRVLLKQNMVSRPFLAENMMGVTGNQNEMKVDSRVLRITGSPGLNLKFDEWKPATVSLPTATSVTRAESAVEASVDEKPRLIRRDAKWGR